MDAKIKHVYVVGAKRLQNELMVCKIFCATGLQCRCVTDLEHIPLTCGKNEKTRRLVLYDYQQTDPDNLQSLKSQLAPDDSLAFYNVKKDSGFEAKAINLGVRGFFYEDDSVDCLTKGIGNIFDGDLWVSRKQMVEYLLHDCPSKRRERLSDHVLTRREEEVLSLVAKGETNDSIAEALCVSHHTIRTHIYNIFKKIKVSNRLQASLWATEHLPSHIH